VGSYAQGGRGMTTAARGAVAALVARASSPAALSEDQRVRELCLLYAAIEAGDVTPLGDGG